MRFATNTVYQKPSTAFLITFWSNFNAGTFQTEYISDILVYSENFKINRS